MKKRAADKEGHLYTGAAISIIANFVAFWLGCPYFLIAGPLIAIIAGGGKELWDKYTGKGTPEWDDFYQTVLGGLVIPAVVYLKLKKDARLQ